MVKSKFSTSEMEGPKIKLQVFRLKMNSLGIHMTKNDGRGTPEAMGGVTGPKNAIKTYSYRDLDDYRENANYYILSVHK